MSKTTRLILTSLAIVVAATSIAAAGPIIKIPMGPSTPTITPSAQVKDALHDAIVGDKSGPVSGAKGGVETIIALDCAISGDDLRLSNSSDQMLPAGTRIKWKALGETGVIKLTGPLAIGQSFRVPDLLEGTAEHCTAKVV